MVAVLVVFADATYASAQQSSWVAALRYAHGRVTEQKAALATPVLKVFVAPLGAEAREYTVPEVTAKVAEFDAKGWTV